MELCSGHRPSRARASSTVRRGRGLRAARARARALLAEIFLGLLSGARDGGAFASPLEPPACQSPHVSAARRPTAHAPARPVRTLERARPRLAAASRVSQPLCSLLTMSLTGRLLRRAVRVRRDRVRVVTCRAEASAARAVAAQLRSPAERQALGLLCAGRSRVHARARRSTRSWCARGSSSSGRRHRASLRKWCEGAVSKLIFFSKGRLRRRLRRSTFGAAPSASISYHFSNFH